LRKGSVEGATSKKSTRPAERSEKQTMPGVFQDELLGQLEPEDRHEWHGTIRLSGRSRVPLEVRALGTAP
jgi:hypothetical protein